MRSRPILRLARAPYLLAALVGGVAACADAPGDDPAAADGWTGTVDTLPSGAVRVRSPAEGVWTPGERWRLVEELRVGALDGRGPELFGRVQDVVAGPGGTFWVIEGQAHEIRAFGPDGRWLRTLGGPGQGPGEFAFPSTAFWSPDDRLWIYDIQNSRFTVYDPAGTHLADHPVTTLGFYPQHAFGEDGTLYVAIGVQDETGAIVSRVVATRVNQDGLQPLDTFPVPNMGDLDRILLQTTRGGRTMTIRYPVPFQGSPTWVVGPDGHLWTGRPADGYRLVERTLEGDTLRIVERAWEPVPITDHEVDSVIAGLEERFDRVDLDGSRLPDVRPAYQSFRRAPDGHLWVQRYDAPGSLAWDVFDPEGRYLGEVAMPEDGPPPSIRDIRDDVVYATVSGDFDETYVVRYRIQKGS